MKRLPTIVKQYPAVRMIQSLLGSPVILFGAPATEISDWSGVPQKKELNDSESLGFQRTVNPKRLRALQDFYREERNVVQNPLLAATRKGAATGVKFVPLEGANDNDSIQLGHLRVEYIAYNKMSLLELLRLLCENLESRLPDLKQVEVDDELIRDLKRQVAVPLEEDKSGSDIILDEDEDEEDEETQDVEADSGGEILLEESHILEFYLELKARLIILQEMDHEHGDEFLGFTRDALVSYLKPITIVDGQHRLEGAVAVASSLLDEPARREKIAELIDQGVEPEAVRENVLREVSRCLPVSLLETEDPAEHVFQFIIVNQKATPIPNALLGTIISTTLTKSEHDRVSGRLEDANIFVQESRHVAHLSRHDGSPFCGVVDRGLRSDGNKKLPFTVMMSLVKMFRDLEGGRPYHESIDYARLWRNGCLVDSEIISGYEDKGFKSAYDYWRENPDVWRQCFIRFWWAVRNKLSSDDVDSHCYWGDTRNSNIFNKVSLHVLQTDFFAYLHDRRLPISSVEGVDDIVTDWLESVRKSYFDRDWKMGNQKKDVPGIRQRWAYQWNQYRKAGGSAPQVQLMSRKLD